MGYLAPLTKGNNVFFNGFTLLLCILSALLGAVVALRIAKSNRDYYRNLAQETDTPIAYQVAQEMHLQKLLDEITKR